MELTIDSLLWFNYISIEYKFYVNQLTAPTIRWIKIWTSTSAISKNCKRFTTGLIRTCGTLTIASK